MQESCAAWSQVANTLWAYATLGHDPRPPLLDAMAAHVSERIHICRPQAVSNSLWVRLSFALYLFQADPFGTLHTSFWSSPSCHTLPDARTVHGRGGKGGGGVLYVVKFITQWVLSCLWFLCFIQSASQPTSGCGDWYRLFVCIV